MQDGRWMNMKMGPPSPVKRSVPRIQGYLSIWPSSLHSCSFFRRSPYPPGALRIPPTGWQEYRATGAIFPAWSVRSRIRSSTLGHFDASFPRMTRCPYSWSASDVSHAKKDHPAHTKPWKQISASTNFLPPFPGMTNLAATPFRAMPGSYPLL